MSPIAKKKYYQWITKEALKSEKFKALLKDYKENKQHLDVVGPIKTQAAFMLSALSLLNKDKHSFNFLIAKDELELRNLENLMKAFYPGEVLSFRPRDFNLTKVESSSKDLMHSRLSVISKIFRIDEYDLKPIVITSPRALLQRMPSVSSLKENFLKISLGDRVEPRKLSAKLAKLGYKKVALASQAGEFAQRGDILDIIPIDKKQAQSVPADERQDFYGVRISFFDVDIDQVRLFDPENQRQVEAVKTVLIPPAEEIIISDEKREELVEKVKDFYKEGRQRLFSQSASRDEIEEFSNFMEDDISNIENKLGTEVLDRYLDFIYTEKTSILDFFLASGGRANIFDLKNLQKNLDASQARITTEISELLKQNKTISLAAKNIVTRAEIMTKLDFDFNVLSFALIKQAAFPESKSYSFQSRACDNYKNKDKELFATLNERRDQDKSTYIFVKERNKRDKLNTRLLEKAPGTVNRIVPRALNQGFEWPDADLMVLGNENIYGRSYKTRKRRKPKEAGETIELFSDLKVGDYVVHIEHGIGVYEGLETITTASGTRDYIKISYAKSDTLYLPMEAIEQLSKYVGTSKPKLNRLGGGAWERAKSQARESIKKLATNLLELYATRDEIQGFKFSEDTVWDKEFADDFPYEETEDQLKALDEIKSDMESYKVMDRLLVGDVGFGKTELAFRAMFKAVSNNKQAAMLTPTTVLTQQHYENFVERVKDYPITVRQLSRFASPKEQKETLKGLKNGTVDVVIGTHRLLSSDVEFKRLGLLVVDEEQRFGVDHKEKLKDKYPAVDVLSLSATPIPRTLHMSLSGIRDISVLNEAPNERRSVQTYVMPFDEDVISEAIRREVSRGGQVFYLINNVKNISQAAQRIEDNIPGVRVDIAHGQMPERQLEDVIQSFINDEIDVLVCTTIIESGIDMPNVNTLIITNADRLGLAQIYQIKGRVGRSSRQAYAYITYNSEHVLTEEAQKRLATIRDYTELGSGVKIAMRDLEVRGAGNLLGGEQHGHMNTIGYNLYVKFLEEEIKKLRKEKSKERDDKVKLVNKKDKPELKEAEPEEESTKTEPTEPEKEPKDFKTLIDIDLEAYISPDYIPQEGERIDIYKRLNDIEGKEDYFDIIDELLDRYGDIPKETQALVDLSYVQSQASKFRISRIFIEGKDLILDFSRKYKPNAKMLAALLNLEKYEDEIIFNAKASGYLNWKQKGKFKSKIASNLRQLFLDIEMAVAKIDEQNS